MHGLIYYVNLYQIHGSCPCMKESFLVNVFDSKNISISLLVFHFPYILHYVLKISQCKGMYGMKGRASQG